MGVTALAPDVLRVELAYPNPDFLHLTSTPLYSPVPMHCPEDLSQGSEWVSNGPFVVEKWDPSHQLVLKKNPLYWREEDVFFDQIKIAIVADAQTHVGLYEKGEIDWLGKPFAKLPLDAIESLKGGKEFHMMPERAVYLYYLNTRHPILKNEKVRRALALGLNRSDIASHLLKEGEQPALSLHAAQKAFEDASLLSARTLLKEGLEELSIQDPKEAPLAIHYCNIEVNHRLAQAVKDDWERSLGLPIELKPQEWTQCYASLMRGDFCLGGLSWHSRIRDPFYDLEVFRSADDARNPTGWEDPHYQSLCEQIERMEAGKKREALVKEAEEYLMKRMPAIPVYFLTLSYAHDPDLTNFYLSDLNEIDFSFARRGSAPHAQQ